MSRGPRSGWSWIVHRSWVSDWALTVSKFALGIVVSTALVLWQGGLDAGPKLNVELAMFVAVGVMVLFFVIWQAVKSGRDRMLKRNGVAFLVREAARDMDARDEPDEFYDEVRKNFADVVPVPGPGMTGSKWDWPLDADARHWDERVTDLVRSFRAVVESVHVRHRDEKRSGVADGIFVTAYWPVAMGFGTRMREGIRNWEPGVWERPSDGRLGPLTPDVPAMRAHRFPHTDERVPVPDGLRPDPGIEWNVDLASSRLPGAGQARADGPVAVLLVRFVPRPWGALTMTDPPPDPVQLEILDAGEVMPAKSTARVPVHELRCTPREGDRFYRWEDFPFLADLAVRWIKEKAGPLEASGHTVLLGMSVPNEVALGMGIRAGRPSFDGWPARLWPVNWKNPDGPLVTARLNLGDGPADGPEG